MLRGLQRNKVLKISIRVKFWKSVSSRNKLKYYLKFTKFIISTKNFKINRSNFR